jgi:hypothetical protein
MVFNPILDEPPTDCAGVPIKSDFRQGLRFFRALADKDLDDGERSMIIVRLFFDTFPEDQNSIWPFIEWFISGGEDKKEGSSGERTFDWNVDAGRLYAAFIQTYGIDLSDPDVKMHWWVFLELFKALPEDTMLLKVMDIRWKKPPKYADDEYKAALRKAKRAFAIDNSGDPARSLGETLKSWAGR